MAEDRPGTVEVTVSSSTFRQKYRVVVIKIQAEKQLFELSDILGKHVGLTAFDAHLELGTRTLIQSYFEKTESVLAQVVSAVAKAEADKK